MAGTAENLMTARQQVVCRNDCGTVRMVSADFLESIQIGVLLAVVQCTSIASACQHS